MNMEKNGISALSRDGLVPIFILPACDAGPLDLDEAALGAWQTSKTSTQASYAQVNRAQEIYLGYDRGVSGCSCL